MKTQRDPKNFQPNILNLRINNNKRANVLIVVFCHAFVWQFDLP